MSFPFPFAYVFLFSTFRSKNTSSILIPFLHPDFSWNPWFSFFFPSFLLLFSPLAAVYFPLSFINNRPASLSRIPKTSVLFFTSWEHVASLRQIPGFFRRGNHHIVRGAGWTTTRWTVLGKIRIFMASCSLPFKYVPVTLLYYFC